MAASIPKSQVISLYRDLMRAAKEMNNYNFRNYAVRHVRDDFRAAVALEGDVTPKHSNPNPNTVAFRPCPLAAVSPEAFEPVAVRPCPSAARELSRLERAVRLRRLPRCLPPPLTQ